MGDIIARPPVSRLRCCNWSSLSGGMIVRLRLGAGPNNGPSETMASWRKRTGNIGAPKFSPPRHSLLARESQSKQTISYSNSSFWLAREGKLLPLIIQCSLDG